MIEFEFESGFGFNSIFKYSIQFDGKKKWMMQSREESFVWLVFEFKKNWGVNDGTFCHEIDKRKQMDEENKCIHRLEAQDFCDQRAFPLIISLSSARRQLNYRQ